jgi:hypothetical protein
MGDDTAIRSTQLEIIMSASSQVFSRHSPSSFSRKILLLDAVTGLLMGIALIAGKGWLAPYLGLPESFIGSAGWVLIPCMAMIGFISRAGSASNPPSAMVWITILGNVVWVVASLLAATVWFDPTGLGTAFILFQAAVVAGFAVLEYRGIDT